jgi:hypothetical protein
LQRARQRDTEKREIDLRAELFNCFEHLRKLRAACDEYLTDPDDEEKYTLDPRAREVSVLYEEHERGADKPKRKRASLEVLLHRLEMKKGLGITVDRTEIRFADPRKLILESLDRFDKHLRMLGDLTGRFKQPAQNPHDDDARKAKVSIQLWRYACRDEKTGELPSVAEALEFLIPAMPELEEELRAAASDSAALDSEALGTWNAPHADSRNEARKP